MKTRFSLKYFVSYCRSLSYRNQSTDLQNKSMDLFLYDKEFRHERVKRYFPVNIYLFKVNNRNTRKRCEICSKCTMSTPERRY